MVVHREEQRSAFRVAPREQQLPRTRRVFPESPFGPENAFQGVTEEECRDIPFGDDPQPRDVVQGRAAVQGPRDGVQKPLVEVNEVTTTTGGSSVLRCGSSQWQVVKFARAHGRLTKLSRSEFVTWALRLEIERGDRQPYRLSVLPLPARSSAVARVSYDGFLYLLQCRWLHTPGLPAPWTHEFASAWCGLSFRQARGARGELAGIGALVETGVHRRTKLWLPWGVTSEGELER
jgi:hypothetical protein